nr:MAG TPA: hypothetical protein [Caudoviricetes sp.]
MFIYIFCIWSIICFILISATLFLVIKTEREIIQDISSLKIKNKTFKREHNGITQVNFSNPIANRRNPYEEYKNEKGLYEPRTPSRGMKIKED